MSVMYCNKFLFNIQNKKLNLQLNILKLQMYAADIQRSYLKNKSCLEVQEDEILKSAAISEGLEFEAGGRATDQGSRRLAKSGNTADRLINRNLFAVSFLGRDRKRRKRVNRMREEERERERERKRDKYITCIQKNWFRISAQGFPTILYK